MPKIKKNDGQIENLKGEVNTIIPSVVPPETTAESVGRARVDVNALLQKIEALEKRDAENQKKLDMLYDVADRGRITNYENQRAEKKPLKVKLSRFGGGIITAWRTVKDELVKHPTTGLTVGEVQEYEVVISGDDGDIRKLTVNGYPSFSNARYTERIEVEVIGKKEDYQGNITFDVMLPNQKVVAIDARFVN